MQNRSLQTDDIVGAQPRIYGQYKAQHYLQQHQSQQQIPLQNNQLFPRNPVTYQDQESFNNQVKLQELQSKKNGQGSFNQKYKVSQLQQQWQKDALDEFVKEKQGHKQTGNQEMPQNYQQLEQMQLQQLYQQQLPQQLPSQQLQQQPQQQQKSFDQNAEIFYKGMTPNENSRQQYASYNKMLDTIERLKQNNQLQQNAQVQVQQQQLNNDQFLQNESKFYDAEIPSQNPNPEQKSQELLQKQMQLQQQQQELQQQQLLQQQQQYMQMQQQQPKLYNNETEDAEIPNKPNVQENQLEQIYQQKMQEIQQQQQRKQSQMQQEIENNSQHFKSLISNKADVVKKPFSIEQSKQVMQIIITDTDSKTKDIISKFLFNKQQYEYHEIAFPGGAVGLMSEGQFGESWRNNLVQSLNFLKQIYNVKEISVFDSVNSKNALFMFDATDLNRQQIRDYHVQGLKKLKEFCRQNGLGDILIKGFCLDQRGSAEKIF